VIGTPGSYRNHGTTIANAFDGNLATFFDGPTANGDWVGLDLGTNHTLSQVSFAPRAGFASRMVGGEIQIANDPNFVTGSFVLVSISTAPAAGTLTTISIGAAPAFRYVRYLAPANSYGNIAELKFFGQPVTQNVTKLTGTVIGTPGSYNNHGTTIAQAFDNNLSTFFDGPTANGNWVGLDLGTAKSIKQISYAPRAGLATRMVGGVFQASNSADFSTGVVTLDTITTAPVANVLTTVSINVLGTYRYVRYLSPANSYGNIAELAFYG
jgi:hypothetical protein